ncbi:PsiF family protein [Caballeronia sp. GACF4]|uniref:PsiF family protein n=1 Tax=Caballeronia sp. GACF4 TaxID=2921763 RepID=UPI00202936C1|nr:PsiF family protein [Caballeronia sp. GACF4]
MIIRATALAAVIAVSSLTISASTAFAANSQQSKMTDCNKQAADKKGDERKAFMKSCLSSSAPAAAPMTQQEKMTACNGQASGKKGDDRKAFMKSCLSNKG